MVDTVVDGETMRRKAASTTGEPQKAIRRGSFGGVEELKACMEGFLATCNEEPKPFVWTATVESITENLSRCRRTLEQIEPGCSSPRFRKRKE